MQIPGQRIFSVPSWAGDETIVAVLGSDGSTERSGDTLALVDLSNTDQPRVKQVLWKKGAGLNVDPLDPVYCRATKICAFAGSDAHGMAIYTLRAGKAGLPKRIERTGYDRTIRDLTFSPDGRYVLFYRNRTDRTRQEVEPPGTPAMPRSGASASPRPGAESDVRRDVRKDRLRLRDKAKMSSHSEIVIGAAIATEGSGVWFRRRVGCVLESRRSRPTNRSDA